jgi:uncharacterized protein YbaR (Trm112 family)
METIGSLQFAQRQKRFMSNQSPISEELLSILRCPVAVHYKDRPDPGHLRLVKNMWLVCDDSQYKYPIRDGIPVLLPEEGAKWKDVPENDLPTELPPAED